jgi:predicted transcriptional regulator
MDTSKLEPGANAHPGTAADRCGQIAREAALIAEADAEIAAGLFVTEAAVDAWIDSIDTDHELPVPSPGR